MNTQLPYREDDGTSSQNLIDWDLAGGYTGAKQSVRDVRTMVFSGLLLLVCFTLAVVLGIAGYGSRNPLPYLMGATFATFGVFLFSFCILCMASDVIKHIHYAEEEYHSQVATIARQGERIAILKYQLHEAAGASVRSQAVKVPVLLTDSTTVIMFPKTKRDGGGFQ